jgi:acetyl esterase/lipase
MAMGDRRRIPYMLVNPTKILKINKALFEMLFFHISKPALQILYIHLKTLYIPPPVSFQIQYGNHKQKLDVYPAKVKDSPIILFYYGGGWRSGKKELYAPIAHNFYLKGYMVVMPDYILFPQATAESMLDDIEHSMEWTIRNAFKYGGDLDNIIVIAHSAGSHLATTCVIKEAFKKFDFFNEKYVKPFQSESQFKESEFNYDRIFKLDESHVLYKGFHRFKAMIMISGPYDIKDHYAFESSRGIEELSGMGRLFGNNDKTFHEYSPTRLLSIRHPSIFSSVLKDYIPRNWLLLHSKGDAVVPYSSSEKLYDQLVSVGVENLEFFLDEGEDHAKFIYQLFNGEGEIYEIIDRFIEKSEVLCERFPFKHK